MKHATRHIAVAALVLVAALVFTAAPAHAVRIPDGSSGTAARSAQILTQAEARRFTKMFLSKYLGPVVANRNDRPRMAVWDCRAVGGNAGRCYGRVTAGTVTCRGLFRVLEWPKVVSVFPVRSVCGI